MRVERGLRETGLERLAIGGGVAANGPLRERMAGLGVELHVPERALCTDNAAMIGSAARWVTPLREFADLDAYASGERGAVSLVLYGRPGCHLCDEARAVLERIGHPFEEVDIEADDELLARYLERIPVIALDGAELYDFFVDEVELRARLDARVRRA